MDIINLVLIVILIGLTAFFVGSEFAIVRVRGTRIDQLIEEGKKSAIPAKKVISNLDEYLSACQLGITVTALGLGWLGKPAVASWLEPLLVQFNIPTSVTYIISTVIAFSLITFLHVVVGELAPKTVAIQKAEQMTLLLARPLIWFRVIMYPFIWTLNGSARLLLKMFGLKPASEHEDVHTEDELRMIVSESYKSGEINQSEFKYVNKIFEFDDRIAKEIMVPRTEIVTLSKDNTIDDFIKIMVEEKYTRYPVIDGDKDHVIGMVIVKEFFTKMMEKRNTTETIENYTRPILRVIDTIPIHELLLKMQKDRIHMAILMDEYGGTSGLVTVEDILEEIVGEIRDEFDLDEVPNIRKIKEDHYIINAKVLISEVNHLLSLDIDDTDIDTIGGWILSNNYEVKQGDIFENGGYNFKVKQIEERQIQYIEIYKTVKSKPEVKEFPVIQKTEIVS